MCPLPRHLIASAALLLSLSAVHAAPTSSRPADGAAGDGQRATRAATQQLAPGQTPQGLSGGEWAGIQKQIEAARYKVTPSDDAQAPWRAVNHALGITAQFGADGATRVQVSGSEQARAADSASLRLTGVGYRQLTPVGAAPERVAEGGQLTYRWSQQLTEWWVNQPGKLEQWFRIEQRPAQASGPLRLAMRLETELKPVMAGPQLQLKDRHGATRLHYDRLKVWDAQGTELPARMQLAGRTLTLAIDDAKAQYPLTIDPSWGQQAYLKASNTAIFQYFGSAVALSGDTLAVGAYGEASKATGVNGDQSDYSAADSGAVYVFTRSGGTWSQQAYLKASNTGKSDKFGSALALSGDTLAVGAYLEDSKAIGVNGNQANNTAADSGAVYVFTRSAGTWSQQAYLKASNTSAEDRFGAALALSGDTLAVGAPYEDSKATGVNGDQADNSAGYAGAVYVFTRSAGTWSQQAYLKASNTGASDLFGAALALSGDTLAVGAYGEDSKATGVNGDQADNSAGYAGAVYVFTRSGGTWSQQAYVKASNTGAGDSFGSALALSGDTLAVGAGLEDSKATGVNGDQADNSAGYAGAVYVFTRSAGTWSQQAYLKASNTGASDLFGAALALSGDTLAVGAGLEDSKATGVNGDQSDNSAFNAGAVYVFTRSGSTWSQQAYLKASNTSAEDRFGAALALSGDTLAVGAHWEDSKATGVNGDQSDNSKFRAGAVYVFKLTHTVSPSVSAAGGGTLTPATPQAVFNGQTTSFTLAPEAGHIIDSVGGTCGGTLAGSTYTTEDIYTDCTVIVTFARTVNGACGSAHGLPSMSAPAANLCSAGTTSTVTGSGPWEWTCQGSNGGSTARCSAPVFTPVTHFEGPSATGTATVKVDLNGGGPFCGFTGTPAMIAAAPGASPARPPGIVFPHGLFEFTASHCTPGSTITLTMQLPSALPAAAKYYKWGPEPGNPTAHWYVLPATIAGTTVTFSITDGAQGDDDLDASNGTIVDQGGPGVPDSGAAVTPVPTLGEWSLMLLGMLAAGMGARRLRARP